MEGTLKVEGVISHACHEVHEKGRKEMTLLRQQAPISDGRSTGDSKQNDDEGMHSSLRPISMMMSPVSMGVVNVRVFRRVRHVETNLPLTLGRILFI